MSLDHMRRALVLTFVLTLANLTATFVTLAQVHRLEHTAEQIAKTR